MSVSLLQPSFFMSKTKSYAQILIGSRLFLTAMAIHLSLRVAPPDLQQGGNSRILYVHVPAARMSIVIYIATAINSSLFPLTKHPLFLRSSGTGTEIGAFSTLFTLVTGGFRGRPMWGTFRVWDARLTSVFILFLIYLGALRFQKLPVESAPISIRAGPIDIPIIKSPVNWWNTSHQSRSISRSGTSIHVPMPIPILSNFANFPFSTRILFVLETRLPIPSFPESPLTEEIEAREGIQKKPSSLGSASMAEWFKRLTWATSLLSCKTYQQFRDRQRLYLLLMRLRPEFEPLREQLLHRDLSLGLTLLCLPKRKRATDIYQYLVAQENKVKFENLSSPVCHMKPRLFSGEDSMQYAVDKRGKDSLLKRGSTSDLKSASKSSLPFEGYPVFRKAKP
ncbi:uncharacterized protein LOC109727539 [Ananas comosus]|uniref:Uncharacterized protein LOC109727539 n=1 Tax=Ananas comosus TaxID=4615 RepID=A0A6P5H796_ANACO|nr:uncharacterized protein LOC109727539 [Ananas comosus]